MTPTIQLLAAAAIGYLLGSIPFGLVLSRLAGHGDIRAIGSGNIGATNVLRTGNKGLAALTLLLDLGKGFAAAALARHWGEPAALAAGLTAVLGHLYPGVARVSRRQGGRDRARRAGGARLACGADRRACLARDRGRRPLFVARRTRRRRGCGHRRPVSRRPSDRDPDRSAGIARHPAPSGQHRRGSIAGTESRISLHRS